jgi:DNA-binding transcriptional LysR family regulator
MTGRVVISTSPTLVNAYLPRAIGLFRRGNPSVQVSIQSLPTPLAIDRVARREADLGVVYAPVLDHGVEAESLVDTEIVCVVPKNHRLARKHEIGSADLVDESVISLGSTTMLGMLIEEASRKAGVAPPVIGIEASSSITACLLASEGAGVALIDRAAGMARNKFNDLAFRAFVPRITVPIKLIYPRDRPRSRATMQLAELLKDVSATDH